MGLIVWAALDGNLGISAADGLLLAAMIIALSLES